MIKILLLLAFLPFLLGGWVLFSALFGSKFFGAIVVFLFVSNALGVLARGRR